MDENDMYVTAINTKSIQGFREKDKNHWSI